MITFSDSCRSMREHLMVIIESEVGKIPTLICRSCACRRLERVGDSIFSLSSCRTYPEIQAIRTKISKLTQVRWERAKGSTSATVIASGKLPSQMASLLTASQPSTDKRSSRKRRKNSIGKSRNTGTRLRRDYLLLLFSPALAFSTFLSRCSL